MISFVIPAYNEEELIDRTLADLEQSARLLDEAFEIIVVNDASTDRTPEIALKHGVTLVDVSHRKISATRNAGARVAKGEILIFVDGDTSVNERVLKAAVSAIRHGAVGGGCHLRFDGDVRLYARIFERFVFPFALPILGLAGGCFFFCTRSAFDEAEGFDESLYFAEEVAFARRLKRQGKFVILRESVTTSGRKVRTYSALDLIRLGILIAFRCESAKDFWYVRK